MGHFIDHSEHDCLLVVLDAYCLPRLVLLRLFFIDEEVGHAGFADICVTNHDRLEGLAIGHCQDRLSCMSWRRTSD